MYKITFELNSAICFVDKPLFDGLITYCYIKDKLGFIPYKLNFSKQELENFAKELEFDKIPLKKHSDGYFIASYMQYEDKKVEFTGSWKKRWANQHDKIADFGKSKRVVEIDKGAFKSYDMPLNLHSISKVWFFFDSDNVKEVERLVTKYLVGIGKKTSQGYGEIKNIELEKIDYNPFEEGIIRPVPLPKEITDFEKTTLMMENKLLFCRYQPPYWSMVDSELCRIR